MPFPTPRTLAGFLALILALAAPLPAQEPKALQLTGDYAQVHDPAIGREGNNYHAFSTGRAPNDGQLPIRCSGDLLEWRHCGHVFDQIPAWIHQESPKTTTLWAPDISFFQGKFYLYYAYSVFGKKTSGIALATNPTLNPASPNYHWTDQGLVLKTTEANDYNAIDPNFILDEKGQPWLCFGSYWSGIKLVRLDPATGKPSPADKTIYSLASRSTPETRAKLQPGQSSDEESIEAPFIVRHHGKFYLFVSFDNCCRGVKSTYRTMVGRSRKIIGPYLDQAGKPMLQGGGTELLKGNTRWVGPGGESILQRPEGDIIVFHAYDAQTGRPALQISTLTWKKGWPQAALGTTPPVSTPPTH